MRKRIAICFLLFQVGMIIYARYTPSRYFCWAPFDSQNEYKISVKIDGRSLTDAEIKDRYRLPAKDLDSRSIQHLKNILAQYERTYGASEHADVRLTYTTNGKPQPEWSWKTK